MKNIPTPEILEAMFRKQLARSNMCKETLALCESDDSTKKKK